MDALPIAQGKGSADERYAEWVGVRLRAAVLIAHARCACHAGKQPKDSPTAEQVQDAQSMSIGKLHYLWLRLLQVFLSHLFSAQHLPSPLLSAALHDIQ